MKAPSGRVLAILMFVLLASGVFGYFTAFTNYGPAYRIYAQNVTEYMRTLPETRINLSRSLKLVDGI